jgi:hypothetical protein|tara:strand:- start:701 stop:928 length:228 start_codon:yes stop_codon:yes gene_type:complete
MDLKSEKAKELTKNQVFEELNKYFKEQIELSQRKCMDEDSFNIPAWSEKQAYQLGLQKAFTKVLNLIPLTQGDKK